MAAEEAKGDDPYAGADASLLEKVVADPADKLGGLGGTEPPHPGLLRHILGSLRPGQDLTRVTIPSFFLEDRSLLEKLADMMMHPEEFIKVPELDDPEARMVQMAKWYLSGWHYKTVGVKKPYNPIVGETYSCMWKHKNGSTSQYFAEQVSHRPPMSALYFENRTAGLVINAQVWTKSKFKAPQTAVSILDGGADVHCLKHKEVYRLTFPTFYAHGLLFGTLRMEVGDKTQIICEASGFQADFEFKQKPMFGGSYHIVTGTISNTSTGQVLYEINGKWNEDFTIKDKRTKKTTKFLDTRTLPVEPKYCLPEELQGPWESRRLWTGVTAELHRRPTVDWAAVDAEKSKLEEAQRLLECHQGGPARATKKFHLRKVYNPITKEQEEMYVFDHMNVEPLKEDERQCNLIWLSRTLADARTPDAPESATAKAEGEGEEATAGAGAGEGDASAGAGTAE